MIYKAVLWDCDGVLIDSEKLACQVVCDMLIKQGCTNITTKDYINRFVGKSLSQALCEIEEETNIPLQKNFPREELLQQQKKIFSQKLKPISGVQNVLKKLVTKKIPIAVASGSSLERLHHSLNTVNLLPYFNQHIYSAETVPNGKPAPDVFLYAAEKLGVNPESCLVIEDGIHGIHAAQSANMDVIAYLGGSHITKEFRHKIETTNVEIILDDINDVINILNLN